jgi:hypothetical protein
VITSGDYVWTGRFRLPCGQRAWVCSRSIVRIAGLNPVEDIDVLSVVFVACCVGSGLCDELEWLLVQRSPTGCVYQCVSYKPQQ